MDEKAIKQFADLKNLQHWPADGLFWARNHVTGDKVLVLYSLEHAVYLSCSVGDDEIPDFQPNH